MLIYQLLYDIIPFDNLPNEYAVMRAVMGGRRPGRAKLPERRAKLPAWRDVETKFWPLLARCIEQSFNAQTVEIRFWPPNSYNFPISDVLRRT